MVKTVNASALTCALRGVISYAIASVILIPVSAWALTLSDDPSMMIAVLPKLIAALSALLGGFICVRGRAAHPLLSSVICGGIIYLVSSALSLILGGSLLSLLIGLICTLVPAVLGGVIGMPREKSSGAKRRAMMKRFAK